MTIELVTGRVWPRLTRATMEESYELEDLILK
jgi:hypothetical protein